MADDGCPEQWAQRPEVMQLLGSVLADPVGDHGAAVAKHFNGTLLDAHVASIVKALGLLRDNPAFDQSFTTDGGVALHTILYHLLGGAGNIPPPPSEYTREEAKRCKPGWTSAARATDAFKMNMFEARRQAKAGDDAMLRRLRGRVFAPERHKNLRSAVAGDTAVEARAAGSKRSSAALPDPPPADAPCSRHGTVGTAQERRVRPRVEEPEATGAAAATPPPHRRAQSEPAATASDPEIARLLAENARLRAENTWLRAPLTVAALPGAPPVPLSPGGASPPRSPMGDPELQLSPLKPAHLLDPEVVASLDWDEVQRDVGPYASPPRHRIGQRLGVVSSSHTR